MSSYSWLSAIWYVRDLNFKGTARRTGVKHCVWGWKLNCLTDSRRLGITYSPAYLKLYLPVSWREHFLNVLSRNTQDKPEPQDSGKRRTSHPTTQYAYFIATKRGLPTGKRRITTAIEAQICASLNISYGNRAFIVVGEPWIDRESRKPDAGKPLTWRREAVCLSIQIGKGARGTMRNPLHVLKSLEEQSCNI